MKNIFMIILLLSSFALFSQQLEFTSDGIDMFFQASPNQQILVAVDGDQYQIYDENYNFLTSFNLDSSTYNLLFLNGIAQDYDTDDNYEVLYTTYDENYKGSAHLKDVETGEMQIEYIGSAINSYYADLTRYFNNERIFVIQSTNYSNTDPCYEFYVYSSGNPQSITNDSVPYPNLMNYPNPFNPNNSRNGMNIDFTLDSAEKVSIRFFNIKGQLVKTLINSEQMNKGKHSVVWYGKNDNSQPLPSGVYFYQVKTGTSVNNKKMILLK